MTTAFTFAILSSTFHAGIIAIFSFEVLMSHPADVKTSLESLYNFQLVHLWWGPSGKSNVYLSHLLSPYF